jgi:hypothetical protein
MGRRTGTSAVEGGIEIRCSDISAYRKRQCLLSLPLPRSFWSRTSGCMRQHRAARPGNTFDLSEDIPSGTAAVWLVPTGSFTSSATPRGGCLLEAEATAHECLVG